MLHTAGHGREMYDAGYISTRLSVVDFHNKFCFDRASPSAQFEGNVRADECHLILTIRTIFVESIFSAVMQCPFKPYLSCVAATGGRMNLMCTSHGFRWR